MIFIENHQNFIKKRNRSWRSRIWSHIQLKKPRNEDLGQKQRIRGCAYHGEWSWSKEKEEVQWGPANNLMCGNCPLAPKSHLHVYIYEDSRSYSAYRTATIIQQPQRILIW